MSTGYATTSLRQRTVRLITSANHRPPVLQRLVASFDAQSKLVLLESVTSGRLNPKPDTLVAAPGIYGQTYINAAFAYPRHAGSRFSPAAWGAWYAAFTPDTALAEVGYHLTRALGATGAFFDNTIRLVELLATFDERFSDLRGVRPVPSCLDPEEDPGYVDGQALGSTIRQAGGNGLVYPSVRHPGGTCLVAFWPHLVLDFQRGATWELVWAGSPEPTIRPV